MDERSTMRHQNILDQFLPKQVRGSIVKLLDQIDLPFIAEYEVADGERVTLGEATVSHLATIDGPAPCVMLWDQTNVICIARSPSVLEDMRREGNQGQGSEVSE